MSASTVNAPTATPEQLSYLSDLFYRTGITPHTPSDKQQAHRWITDLKARPVVVTPRPYTSKAKTATQRIDVLEAQVAELTAKLDALVKATS